jgi:hypothetical protein
MLWAAVLTLGTAGMSFAGNHPALTYPSGILVAADSAVQSVEVTPWHKGALTFAAGKPEVLGTSPKMDEATPWHKGALHYSKGILISTQSTLTASSDAKKITLTNAKVKN